MEKEHGIDPFDPGSYALDEAAYFVGNGPGSDVFVGAGCECRIFKRDSGVLVNDCVDKGITVHDMCGSCGVHPLYYLHWSGI